MDNYINLFETKEDYLQNKESLPTPNVSLIEETMEVKLSSIDTPALAEYVDLGLPSGTLWATCNLGATSPEQSGLFFSWGNVAGHTGEDGYDFSQETYNSTTGKSLTTDIPANSTYDAAVAIKGEPWQIPTKEQFVELFNDEYTSSVWTKINGKPGRLVTSKINNKSVFFPASGRCNGTSHGYEGSLGYYWSTSYSGEINAYFLYFHSDAVSPEYVHSRYYGFTIRPVQNMS